MALQQDLPTNIRMINILGGLAPDTTEPMPAGLQKAIQQTWHQIEKTVPGIQFNFNFWLLNTPYRSTYPACRAILAAKKQGTEFEAKILHAIQTAYYQKARNPSLQATLQECAAEVGMDALKFMTDLTTPIIENELQREIQLTISMGVSSYPSLRLLHHEELFSINIDYLNYRTMRDEMTSILNKPSL
jgi:putative protein-disulfide isomerase